MTQQCWQCPVCILYLKCTHMIPMATLSLYMETLHIRTESTCSRHTNLNAAQQQFNKSMSSVRVAVEWLFGEIATYFAFNDFKKNSKIGLQSVSKIYPVSCLIFNAKTCLYGSQTSQFFQLVPPHLDEHFSQSM